MSDIDVNCNATCTHDNDITLLTWSAAATDMQELLNIPACLKATRSICRSFLTTYCSTSGPEGQNVMQQLTGTCSYVLLLYRCAATVCAWLHRDGNQFSLEYTSWRHGLSTTAYPVRCCIAAREVLQS